MSDRMIKLVCERGCGHPDEEVQEEALTPQWYMECPNCHGWRVPFEPDETDEEWLDRMMQSSVTIHTPTGDEEITLPQLVALTSVVNGGDGD